MSPAKRLSRQRFRALCERCAEWLWSPRPRTRLYARMERHVDALDAAYQVRGSRHSCHRAVTTVMRHATLARLAR